jgi:hypothetical protein
MKYGINLSINVKAIDKARLQAKGDKIWLNATVFFKPEEPDNYGQHGMITQDITKEEKDNGVKSPILGNTKCFWKDEEPQQQEKPQQQPDDDIPW